MIEQLRSCYGHLFEPGLLEEIEQLGVVKEVSEGSKWMEIGQFINGMPLLVSGVIKILRVDEQGDELLLYFLEAGDTCAMTMACCMGRTKSEIRAITETGTVLIMIPVQKMEEWIIKYKTWRDFVFESYHNRLMEMLQTIDTIAFLKMDERLLNHLREKVKVNKDHSIRSTHQEIAYELHTSRVVVSRLLKKLENMGVIELKRNIIRLVDDSGPAL